MEARARVLGVDDVAALGRARVAFLFLVADRVAAERDAVGLDRVSLGVEREDAPFLFDDDEVGCGERRVGRRG